MGGTIRSLLVTPVGALGRDTGGGQRTKLFAEALSGLGDVDIVALDTRGSDWTSHTHHPRARVRRLASTAMPPRSANPAVRIARNIWKSVSIQSSIKRDSRFHAGLDDLVRREGYDLVVFRFFPTLVASGPPFGADNSLVRPLVCLDLDDRDDQKYQAAILSRVGPNPVGQALARKIARDVRSLFRRHLVDVAQIWITTDEDRLDDVACPQTVIPNVPADVPAVTGRASEGRAILFVGGAGHPPNVEGMRWFLRTVWPRILERRSGASCHLVGGGNWKGVLGQLAHVAGLHLVGRVEELGPSYGNARLAVIPSFSGGGSKVKLIEACACGRPVVCTAHATRGFAEGLREDLIVRDRPEAFAEACLDLLDRPAFADELGEILQQHQKRYYSLQGNARRIREDLSALLERRARQEPARRA